MENLRKLGILLMIFSLLCMNAELMAQYNEVIRDITSYCYEPSSPPENAIDNNMGTHYVVHPYVNCPESYKNIQLDITLNRIIQAASIRIVASTPGIQVGVGNESNYHVTLLTDEILYVVKPDGFETISLFRSGSGSVTEITIEEIDIAGVSMPFDYDAGGKMTYRSFYLGIPSRKTGYAENPTNPLDLNQPDLVFEEIGDFGIRLYPNPTERIVRIELNNNVIQNSEGVIRLYTIAGLKIRELEIEETTTDINMEHFPPGIYLVRVTVGNETKTWKIVKN